jgi:two-component system sensor histidine kinase FlrB
MENLFEPTATLPVQPEETTGQAAPAALSEAQLSPLETLRLAEAFRVFNQASEELSTAYTKLQAQVAELTSELAAANGALRQQYLEKAALTERLSLLLSALPAGVVVLDVQGQIVQANPAAGHMLAPDAADAGGDALIGHAWLHVEQTQLTASETPGEYLSLALDAQGRRRAVAVTVTALDSAGGRIVLLHDITEAQRLKTQAERNQRLAAMGEMAAQLAHQLRTPLAAALLYTGNLEAAEVAPEMRIRIAGKAVARLKHLERLIQDMLLFARGEVLGREAIDVADLLRELRHIIAPLARTRVVDFQVQAADGLPALQGNRKALVGALTNLLENALQAAAASAHGSVRLSAALEADWLVLRVCDNGPGMTPDVAARVFEPFYTTRTEGTGLGLAIARGVVRAHNGNLEVNSSPGAGAEFVVSLPLQAGQEFQTIQEQAGEKAEQHE